MADIVFKVVAILVMAGGFITAALIVFASAMGSATNMTEAEKTIRWSLLPAAIGLFGIFLVIKAF